MKGYTLALLIFLLVPFTTAQAHHVVQSDKWDECTIIYDLQIATGTPESAAAWNRVQCIKPNPPNIPGNLDLWIPNAAPGDPVVPGSWDDDEFVGQCCGTYPFPQQGEVIDRSLPLIRDWLDRQGLFSTHAANYLTMLKYFEMDPPVGVDDILGYQFHMWNAREEESTTIMMAEDLVYDALSNKYQMTAKLRSWCTRYCMEGATSSQCSWKSDDSHLNFRPLRDTCNMELRVATLINNPDPDHPAGLPWVTGPLGPTIQFVPEPGKASGLIAGVLGLGLLARRRR